MSPTFDQVLTDTNSALSTINVAVPILTAAYEALKGIWTRANPGKTDADFIAALQGAAGKLVLDADAILQADGYVRGADGNWSKA